MNRKLLRRGLLPLVMIASIAILSSALAADVVAKVGNTSLGKVVVNNKGMSIYVFDLDKVGSGASACTGQCSLTWPPVTSTTAKPVVSGIKGVIGTITLKSGRKQVTVNGRPIYTFRLDRAVADTMGQGSQGIWYVLSPTGTEMKTLKSAAKTTAKATMPPTYPKYSY